MQLLLLLLGLISGSAAIGAETDVTVPGYPLVDGPGPHKRVNSVPLDRSKPYVIGHRGNSGEFPEHSAMGYLSAINHGADFIECDVVLTKDLIPICRHEPLISNTTNADDLFPHKVKTYTIDGGQSVGVHSIDLTLKQIKKLSVRERLYARSQVYNDHFPIVTLAEHIEMAQNAPRVVGIYPETKHPTWHDSILKERGHKTTITDIVLKMIRKKGYNNKLNSAAWLQRPIFLQSFETKNLAYARSVSDVPIIQLLDDARAPIADGSFPNYGALLTAEGLAATAVYANGIGPWKELLVNASSGMPVSTGVVERAHAAGLQVHLYTLRNELPFHTATLTSIASEYEFYFKTLGVDGGFTDFPGTLVPWMKNETAKGTKWSNKLM